MALVYANIKHEHREILLKDKPQSMLVYSPKGTVPVLIVDDKVIDESLDVMLWALEQSDRDRWLDGEDQFELIELCDGKFKAQLDCYKYSDRHALSEVEYRDQALWFLQLLDDKLRDKKFLFSEQNSLADIAVFPFIRQFAFVNKPWFDNASYKCLQKWLTFHLNSDLFQRIMIKHDTWQEY